TPTRPRSPPPPAPTSSWPGVRSSVTNVRGRRRRPSGPPCVARPRDPGVGAGGTTRARAAPGRLVGAGAGVVGTWHALEFLRAGFAVEHLDAKAEPTGASVRNFGLLWV